MKRTCGAWSGPECHEAKAWRLHFFCPEIKKTQNRSFEFYSGQKMVGVVELESTTFTMSTWRSNQLSYTPVRSSPDDSINIHHHIAFSNLFSIFFWFFHRKNLLWVQRESKQGKKIPFSFPEVARRLNPPEHRRHNRETFYCNIFGIYGAIPYIRRQKRAFSPLRTRKQRLFW